MIKESESLDKVYTKLRYVIVSIFSARFSSFLNILAKVL